MITDEAKEHFLETARYNYQQSKLRKDNDAQTEAVKKEEAEKEKTLHIILQGIAHLYQGTAAAQFVEYIGNGRAKFAGYTFAAVKAKRSMANTAQIIGVVYTCEVCGEEHVHPTPDIEDFGEYLERHLEIAKKCPNPPNVETAETQLLQALRNYMAQAQ